jgi:hypothetical protein
VTVAVPRHRAGYRQLRAVNPMSNPKCPLMFVCCPVQSLSEYTVAVTPTR